MGCQWECRQSVVPFNTWSGSVLLATIVRLTAVVQVNQNYWVITASINTKKRRLRGFTLAGFGVFRSLLLFCNANCNRNPMIKQLISNSDIFAQKSKGFRRIHAPSPLCLSTYEGAWSYAIGESRPLTIMLEHIRGGVVLCYRWVTPPHHYAWAHTRGRGPMLSVSHAPSPLCLSTYEGAWSYAIGESRPLTIMLEHIRGGVVLCYQWVTDGVLSIKFA